MPQNSPEHLSRRRFLTLGLGTGSLLTLTQLSGCTASQIRQGITAGHQLYKGNVSQAVAAQIPGSGIPQIDGLVRKQVASLLDELTATWGEQRIATPKEYVKYTDHYKSRALIQFTTGQVQVETVMTTDPKAALKKAIVSTLLTPTDPTQVDLLSAKAIKPGQTPFLLDLVRDQDNQAIRYAWRANRYADYLIEHHYQQRKEKGKTRYFVTFAMVKDYQGQQQHRYQLDVVRQAKRFNLEPALIYGIIETESAFNPFAMSSIPAYGLMQIVPSSAGRDVYRMLHGKDGMPSQKTLFQPSHNIEYGAAYLSILFNRYLPGITDPKSQEYCVIAAYNTGSGNVLRAFHSNRQQAIHKINRLNSDQVYQHLTRHLSHSEARRYVAKVSHNKRKYQLV